jgi:hypothetical protein
MAAFPFYLTSFASFGRHDINPIGAKKIPGTIDLPPLKWSSLKYIFSDGG